MAKRFTDTNKWKKDFIRGLQGAYKLLWLYIIDECDHAGIWHVEIDVAAIRIGEQINKEDALKQFEDKIIEIDGGKKWFIPDFIDFQYGKLNPDNRVHKSVIDQLNKYKIKGYGSPLQGGKDKDKDKDKDMDKDKNPDFDKIIDKYNTVCNSMPKVTQLSDLRKKAINARIKEHGIEKVYEVFTIAGKSKFLNGNNDKNWAANFDWMMKPTNFIKILEGNYDKSTKKSEDLENMDFTKTLNDEN